MRNAARFLEPGFPAGLACGHDLLRVGAVEVPRDARHRLAAPREGADDRDARRRFEAQGQRAQPRVLLDALDDRREWLGLREIDALADDRRFELQRRREFLPG